jgi:D-arabinose 5-phosphate isomerase GutQ
MIFNDMVAPPPLAADVALYTTVQCQLCIENICVATSQILTLIRTLRLSLLLMDDDTISAEEYIQVQEMKLLTNAANTVSMELENEYNELLKNQLG